MPVRSHKYGRAAPLSAADHNNFVTYHAPLLSYLKAPVNYSIGLGPQASLFAPTGGNPSLRDDDDHLRSGQRAWISRAEAKADERVFDRRARFSLSQRLYSRRL